MSDLQATMTGRTSLHFSVFWPFMLAGAVGPQGADNPGDEMLDGLPVAPIAGAVVAPSAAENSSDDGATDAASISDWESEAGGDATRTADVGETLAPGQDLPGPDVVNTPRYLQVFVSIPVEDAVPLTFCRAAQLGGALFGDNVASTTSMTEEQIKSMEGAAHALGVDCVQTLYKFKNTSKLHRLVQHLGAELRGRGNLWEGDTSENERLHASCKQMFRRSNKRGPNVTLQMMRCDEAQYAILQQAKEDTGAPTSGDLDTGSGVDEAIRAAADGNSAGSVPTRTDYLPLAGRARRVPVAALARSPELARIAHALGADGTTWVTTHITVRIVARFEWGAPSIVQHLRATRDFAGKPLHSFVRYETTDGGIEWGRLRVNLRCIGACRRNCVVLQRMRPVAPRAGCILTSFNCVRLGWDVDTDADDHPALEVVDAARILRAEDVQMDYQDLSDRLGLYATPLTQPDTATERRMARYFTNPFFPWTTCAMRPGL